MNATITLKLLMLSWISPLILPNVRRLLRLVRLTQGLSNWVAIKAMSRRYKRDKTESEINNNNKNSRADYENDVADKLHQGLREKLIELVGIVVDARNKIACLVLIEKGDRKLLKFAEYFIAQIEKQSPAHASHGYNLQIV